MRQSILPSVRLIKQRWNWKQEKKLKAGFQTSIRRLMKQEWSELNSKSWNEINWNSMSEANNPPIIQLIHFSHSIQSAFNQLMNFNSLPEVNFNELICLNCWIDLRLNGLDDCLMNLISAQFNSFVVGDWLISLQFINPIQQMELNGGNWFSCLPALLLLNLLCGWIAGFINKLNWNSLLIRMNWS